jgi:hypothetical protein
MDANQPETPSATVDEIDVDVGFQVSSVFCLFYSLEYKLNLISCHFFSLPVSHFCKLRWLVPSSGTLGNPHTDLVCDSSSSLRVVDLDRELTSSIFPLSLNDAAL